MKNEIEKLEITDLEKLLITSMRNEIDANKQKGDFFSWNPSHDELFIELEHHVEKLRLATSFGNESAMAEHYADIANYSLKFIQITKEWII